MRAVFALFILVLSSLAAPIALAEVKALEEKVVVYNWSEYIPEGVLEAFTKETGIKVEYTTFDSNEVMYTRLKIYKGRGYDVVFPSTYLISRMRDEGLIQPLDHKRLKNMKHLNPDLMNKPFDPKNTYSIPYLWGSTGIGINSSKIKADAVKSWFDLWSTDYRNSLLLTDDMREVFHMALKVNGHSTNSTNLDEIKQAYELLKQLMPNVKLFSGEPRPEFMNGNVDLGLMWSGEMAIAKQENSVFEYIYPKEGPTMWIDNFVIPSRAKNVANAHVFIDFMLRPEIAAKSTEDLGYATPNMAGKELLDKSLKENPIIFPPSEVLANAEFQKDIGTAHKTYELYWNKLKTLLNAK